MMRTASAGKWDDLIARMGSGAVISAIGIAAIWIGGIVFLALVTLVISVMVWELVRMLGGRRSALFLALVAGCAFVASTLLPAAWALPLLLAPAMLGFGRLGRNRALYAVFTVLILVAGYGLFELRGIFGLKWMVWLILVVAATDVFGYFAGRMIGGPKFWPRVSPKKTWAGTAAGWIAAAVIGMIFWLAGWSGPEVIGISIALSMASQLGDIAESAVKRQMGVKDSSRLLPGHGGVFDRFDGVLGASVFLLLVEQMIDFPPVAI